MIGTLLFIVNQLNMVVGRRATPDVWMTVVVTPILPFGVSNSGILVAS